MALPRLNEIPQYELKIPSTGKLVKYRPFLVKEQKVLIMALESQDQRQMLNAILNCIDACVDDVDIEKLSTFDTEYIFTQVRTKSVGETTTVNMLCTDCEVQTPVKINLEDIHLSEDLINSKKKFIKLTDDISIELKYPTYHEFLKTESTEGIGMVYEMMKACIEAVIVNDEERIAIRDESKEEVENFINSLNSEQFDNLRQYVESIPKISLDVNWNCEGCNENKNRTLEGLTDFFS